MDLLINVCLFRRVYVPDLSCTDVKDGQYFTEERMLTQLVVSENVGINHILQDK